jgi:hypothetical protein
MESYGESVAESRIPPATVIGLGGFGMRKTILRPRYRCFYPSDPDSLPPSRIDQSARALTVLITRLLERLSRIISSNSVQQTIPNA